MSAHAKTAAAPRRLPAIGLAARTPAALLVCVLLGAPFLLATIPPLTDLPGHMGAAAVATYASDPAFARFMSFHWHLVPNLGTDLIVAALQGSVGITRAYWIAAAIIPPLLALGILTVSRATTPRGAAALPWALVFVYCYPLNYGFLNYMLGVAGALIGFAAWMRLDHRPRLREAAAWLWVPLLFLCHVVAGCLFVLFAGSRELQRLPGPLPRLLLLREPRQLLTLLARTRPLLSCVPILVAWRLDASSFAGHNNFSVNAKFNAVLMLLRDQDMVLDIASLVLACAVFAAGWRSHARPHPAVAPALLFLVALFLLTPSSLSGSSYADERLLPLLPMLAFATQDWRRAPPRLARLVAVSGLALLALRLALTTASFAAYDARYRAELAALPHIPPHSRVLVLNERTCSLHLNWRGDRLDHLGELATVYRRSWTNSEWDVDGAHLLQILYRPSPRFYDDPSQYVWPAVCGGLAKRRPTIGDALAAVPFDGIDELWLIDAALPPGYANPRLAEQWHNDDSTLYAVLPR